MDKAFIEFGSIKYELDTENDEQFKTVHEINKPKIFEGHLLKKNLPLFSYNQEVIFYVVRDGQKHILFRGSILTSEIDDKKITLKGADHLEEFKHTLIGGEFLNFKPQDIVYHIVKTSPLTPKIHQTLFDGTIFNITIIIPIHNLSLSVSELTIGDCQIHKDLPANVTGFESNGILQEFSKKNTSYFILRTQAIDYIEAHKHSYEKANLLLDWLSYLRNYSISMFGDEYIEWDKNKINSKPFLSTLFYGEMEQNPAKLILDHNIKRDSYNWVLTEKDSTTIINKNAIFLNLKTYSDLQSAFHWLRRAREFGNIKDQLLDCFTCIEFLVKKEESPELIDKSKRKEINKLVKGILEKKQYDRFTNYMGQINSPSFKMRLSTFIERLNVVLEEDDKRILDECRMKRNNIIHGDDNVKITQTERDHLIIITEKLINGRLNEVM